MTLKDYTFSKNRKILNTFFNKLVVYRIYNIINNKSYIGITSRLRARVREHLSYINYKNSPCRSFIHKAVAKYGLEHFEFEILDSDSKSDKELNDKEKYFIEMFKSNRLEFGYNLTDGGLRSSPNEETLLKKINSSKKQAVAKYDLNGNFIESYNSVKEAARQNLISDTDIHRCHKRKWSRNGFLYKKFLGEPELKIEPYISKVGLNLIKGDSFKGKNKIKCALLNKINNTIEFEAESIEELSKISGIHSTTLHKIFKNKFHKKWSLIKGI